VGRDLDNLGVEISAKNGQVRLTFETREEAVAYSDRNGIAFQLSEPAETRPIIKAYADNFAVGRREPWTH
jgi:hypothetical protein